MFDTFYECQRDLDNRGVICYYKGAFSQDIVSKVAVMVRKKLRLDAVQSGVGLKVFSVVIELMQNIMHYSFEKYSPLKNTDDDTDLRFGVVMVGRQDNHFYVFSGNEVENSQIDHLNSLLNQLQGMDKEELKKFYKQRRRQKDTAAENNSKGAGLGLIEVSRKASRPLEFEFRPANEATSFFSIKIVI